MRRKPRNVHFLVLYKKLQLMFLLMYGLICKLNFRIKYKKYTIEYLYFLYTLRIDNFNSSLVSMEFCEQKPNLQKDD